MPPQTRTNLPESYHSLAVRTSALATLSNTDLLIRASLSLNQSLAATRAHYQRILYNLPNGVPGRAHVSSDTAGAAVQTASPGTARGSRRVAKARGKGRAKALVAGGGGTVAAGAAGDAAQMGSRIGMRITGIDDGGPGRRGIHAGAVLRDAPYGQKLPAGFQEALEEVTRVVGSEMDAGPEGVWEKRTVGLRWDLGETDVETVSSSEEEEESEEERRRQEEKGAEGKADEDEEECLEGGVSLAQSSSTRNVVGESGAARSSARSASERRRVRTRTGRRG